MTDIQDNQEIEAQTTETETVDTETEPVENDGGKLHREAAKYRTQLRETETALETITGQRNQLAAKVVEQHLPANISPRAFWKLADPVNTFIAEDGSVDMDKVTEAAESIAQDLGLNTGPVIAGQEKRPHTVNTGNSLHKAFEPR